MNIFKQFFVSLYDPQQMAKFRSQRVWKTILYVFFIALISIIPISTLSISSIKSGVNAMSEIVSKELPPFSIENGKLISDKKTTITSSHEDFTIIFDNNGEIKSNYLKNETNAIALLEKEIVFVANGVVQATPYSTMLPFNLSSEDICAVLTYMKNSLSVILFLTVVGIFLIGSLLKFIELFILSLFGTILKSNFNKQLTYKEVWTVSAYALTIPTTFFTIMSALKTVVAGGFLINWAVSIILLVLILKEIRKETEQKA